jgi:hypothetical protein
LFSFGRAATSYFNTKLFEGKARLDFARPENRELWLAGYLYIKSLIQKGTYRTALEWAKLLMSLDPEDDPYRMGLIIHELALRAGENKWLLEVRESGMSTMWTAEEMGRHRNSAFHTMPSYVLAAMNLKDGTKSRELLSEYMQSMPWLFVRMFSELSLQAPPTIWGIMPRNDAEKLFTELYVLQTKDMWGTTEATALLMEIAHTIPKVDADSLPKLSVGCLGQDLTRFIYLENNPTLMALVPSWQLHRDSAESDPYPPYVNIFSYPIQQHAIRGAEDPARELLEEFDDTYDPVAAMLRMLPGRQTNVDGRPLLRMLPSREPSVDGLPLPDRVLLAHLANDDNADLSDRSSLPELAAPDGDAPTYDANARDANGQFIHPRPPGFLARALSMFTWGPAGPPEGHAELRSHMRQHDEGEFANDSGHDQNEEDDTDDEDVHDHDQHEDHES